MHTRNTELESMRSLFWGLLALLAIAGAYAYHQGIGFGRLGPLGILVVLAGGYVLFLSENEPD
jgi:hypothetical protein